MRDNYSDTRGWYGFDLDGTLAETIEPFDPKRIGKPVVPMVEKVRGFLLQQKRVKIFTSRVCVTGQSSDAGRADEAFAQAQYDLIGEWNWTMFRYDLEITCIKDFLMIELYDDRAWRVERNTGLIFGVYHDVVTKRSNPYSFPR